MLLQALETWWLLLSSALISMNEDTPNIYSTTLDHSVCSKTAQAHPFIVCNHQASNQPNNQPMCEGICDNSFHSRPPFQTLGNQQVVSLSSPHHVPPQNVCIGSNGQSNTHVAYHKRRESEEQSKPCRMRLCFKVGGVKGNKFCIQWYFQQWYFRYILSLLHDLSQGNIQLLDNTRGCFPWKPTFALA